MILGMSISAFTTIHVVLSLIGIAAGFVVVAGLFGSKRVDGWTGAFLATTILTSVTGYFFPVDKILPSHIVGAVSLIVLAVAVLSYYRYHLQGSSRWIYVVTALVALWLNVFVAVAQSFAKFPFLHSIAPTQSEPPFVISQLVVLIVFVALGIGAIKSFHPASSAPSLRPA